MPLLGACTGAVQQAQMQHAQDNLNRFLAATQQAVSCRVTAAQSPRFEILNRRMPLTDVGAATLPQMIAPGYASSAEVSALDEWLRVVNTCRGQLLQATTNTLPSFVPIIEASRDNDDAAFVGLARHKHTWGETIMRLKDNRTRFRAALIARADQAGADLSTLQQQQLDRRATVLSSVIRILP
ncbi:MAG TPA: hypothetical protein PLD10_18500 [Rhodopila sp.]|nr:hypothetical protein [Rhodopila sp.]